MTYKPKADALTNCPVMFVRQHDCRRKQILSFSWLYYLFAKTVCHKKKVFHTPLLATNVSLTYRNSFIDIMHVIYNYFISKSYPKGTWRYISCILYKIYQYHLPNWYLGGIFYFFLSYIVSKVNNVRCLWDTQVGNLIRFGEYFMKRKITDKLLA